MIYHLLSEAEMFSERTGGAISRWAANVLRNGTEVVVCPSFDSSWGFPSQRIYCLPNWKLMNFPVHPIVYRLPWIVQKEVYLRVFQPLLQKLKPGDIVYVHNAPESASVLSTVVARHGARVILHMHNSHLIRANKGQLAALKKTPIVFCSEFLRKEVNLTLPNHFDSTHVVYNGADASKFHVADRDNNVTPTVIFTGRIVPYKGVHILLSAMALLQRRGVEAKCQVVGRPYFASNRSTRYSRYLDRIRPANSELLGYKSGGSLAQLLQSAHIFCCPSIWNDPFPLAPIEAMATGLPVVASNTGGIPEMLSHGGGTLVPRNDPEALANELETLVRDVDYREQIGAAATSAFRNHFLWSSVRLQYESVIGSFIL
jgi:spore coat protein SA